MMKHVFQGNCLNKSPQHSARSSFWAGMPITLKVVVCSRISSHRIAQLGVFSRTSRILLLDLHQTELEILIVILLSWQDHNLVAAHNQPKVEGTVHANTRTVGSQSADLYRADFTEPGESSTTARCDIYSLADTVCAGENLIPLSHQGTECDVSVYSDDLGTMKNIPDMTVATAVDVLSTHKTHILTVTFVLYFGPKIIEECPRHFNPASKHGLTTPDQSLFVPFKMHDQTSLSRQPSEK
jgi:hypothetical protein